ncbi:hypothetical protein F8388_007812 [Cannabis sativa]|uniref:RRM domain-containing protein n=1 Tax=Cannabis sativa TaxID=3483 RepID=A0A7J6FT58_CANSA|nr:hypothetical protein F8388_007812 [Cannabis sativa]
MNPQANSNPRCLDTSRKSANKSGADSPPRKRVSPSPSPPRRAPSRSRSRSRSWSRPVSRSRSRSWSRPRPVSQSRSRGRPEAINPGNTLYVTGLSTRVTERELEDHFSKEGKAFFDHDLGLTYFNVASCFLVVEPRSRVSRGFAFVTMDNVDDAERCIKYLNQSVLEGRYITVERSRRKRARTPTPGHYLGLKSTRDHGYRGGGGGGSDRDRDRGGDRGRYRGGGGGGGRDDYGYRGRSPRRSPYRGGREYYSPRHSSPPPYGGRPSRRDRSRSPYGSPERKYIKYCF